MPTRARPLRIALVGALLTAGVAAFTQVGRFDPLETWLHPLRVRWAGSAVSAADDRLVVLTPDAQALAAIGPQPWPAATWAALLTTLHEAGAVAVAVDLDPNVHLAAADPQADAVRPTDWAQGRLPTLPLAMTRIVAAGTPVLVVADGASRRPFRAVPPPASPPLTDFALDDRLPEVLAREMLYRKAPSPDAPSVIARPRWSVRTVRMPPAAWMAGADQVGFVLRADAGRPTPMQPLIAVMNDRVLPSAGLALAAAVLDVGPLELARAYRDLAVPHRFDSAHAVSLAQLWRDGRWDATAARGLVEGRAVLIATVDGAAPTSSAFHAVMTGRLDHVAPRWVDGLMVVGVGAAATGLCLALTWPWALLAVALLMAAVFALVGVVLPEVTHGWASLTPLLTVIGLVVVGVAVSAGAADLARRLARGRVHAADPRASQPARRMEAVVLAAEPGGAPALIERFGETAADLLADLRGAMVPAIEAAEPLDVAWRDHAVRCVFAVSPQTDADLARAAARALALAMQMQEIASAFRQRLRRRFADGDEAASPPPRLSWHGGLAAGTLVLKPDADGLVTTRRVAGQAAVAAARLCELSGRLGLTVLIDERTHMLGGSGFVSRLVGVADLLGGRTPGAVQELLAERHRAGASLIEQAELSRALVNAFMRRQPDACRDLARQLDKLGGKIAPDPLPRLYERLVNQRLTSPASEAEFDPTLA